MDFEPTTGLDNAKAKAMATEFTGDMRVGFIGMKNAAMTLLREVERLEKIVEYLIDENLQGLNYRVDDE